MTSDKLTGREIPGRPTISADRVVAEASPTTSVSVSIVVYRSDPDLLRATVASLGVALSYAHDSGVLATAIVDMVDNGDEDPVELGEILGSVGDARWITQRVRSGGGNVGYGRGHNGPLLDSKADYHLILNPDVLLDPDAIAAAIRFLDSKPDVGLVAPHVRDMDGEQQYLCRAYPTVLVLFLRGFAPAPIRRLFQRYMHRHELRDRIGDRVEYAIPLVSGCFMFARRELLQRVGGFCPDYFMYFEDSDISLAMGRVARIAYVPSVRIVHFGGGAARKGLRHTKMFVRSAATFFRRNGLRIA